MSKPIPLATIQTLARSIFKETTNYGFGQVDTIRLVNELMDYCTAQAGEFSTTGDDHGVAAMPANDVTELPIKSSKLIIRAPDTEADRALLETWLSDKYGRYFVLSAAAASFVTVDELIGGDRNHLGIITTLEGQPIGALAFLDHDADQRRAELRKLIGEADYRGKGFAEEATRLWLAHGVNALGLEKIYVSTLQTHINNIKLNERIGFQVEGLLRDEVRIDDVRHDVLRMGYCKS